MTTERIEALRANRLANEQWIEECKPLDSEDRAILQYRIAHDAKMLEADHALSRIQIRDNSTRSRPADHRRLAEKLAPQCLRDAIARIDDEIDKRTHVGKITSGSNPALLNGPMYRQPTPYEVACRERAEAVKLKLENLYTVEEDLAPHIAKLFADLRQADAEAEQAELQRTEQAQPAKGKGKAKTLKELEALALAGAGTYGDDGIAAEIEVG